MSVRERAFAVSASNFRGTIDERAPTIRPLLAEFVVRPGGPVSRSAFKIAVPAILDPFGHVPELAVAYCVSSRTHVVKKKAWKAPTILTQLNLDLGPP